MQILGIFSLKMYSNQKSKAANEFSADWLIDELLNCFSSNVGKPIIYADAHSRIDGVIWHSVIIQDIAICRPKPTLQLFMFSCGIYMTKRTATNTCTLKGKMLRQRADKKTRKKEREGEWRRDTAGLVVCCWKQSAVKWFTCSLHLSTVPH